MFKAKSLSDNVIVNLKGKHWRNKREELKGINKKNGFVCQSCLKKVVLAWAAEPKTAPHFRHNPKNISCDQNDESVEHAKGKELLYEYFQSRYLDIAEEIDIEHYIEQTRQIADVYIKFKNGQEWAIEYQRSNMSLDILQKRKELYKKANIKDIWIVGENLAKIQSDDSIGIKRIAQAIIQNTNFNKNCLIVLNPVTEKIGIYRNIYKINSRRHNGYKTFYPLDDIEFNLVGEVFGWRDVVDFKECQYNFIHSTKMTLPRITLQKSNLSAFKFLAIQEIDGKTDQIYLDINDELLKFIPKTCKDVNIKVDYVLSHKDICEEGIFHPMKISPHRWENKIRDYNMQSIGEIHIDFTRWWYVISELYSMATIENRFYWLELHVPLVRKRRFLSDKGIIDKLYEPNSKVELKQLLFSVLKVLKIQTEDVLQEALRQGFITVEDEMITNKFVVELLKKAEVICVERFNALGKGKIEIMF
ncbi:competence protein CoiA [Brevibacillus laterosporus]|uniref:competence protein CoiA n=1 Tax=Brevibacillus laterosporus TaxID=1465 RepID=UPI001EF2BFA9|nr:competence protein CoiA family protein [Brevibacillus laterosporus]MCG7317646.1 competence protein CoiA [Brevibacillus laterosporus]